MEFSVIYMIGGVVSWIMSFYFYRKTIRYDSEFLKKLDEQMKQLRRE